MKPLNGCSFSQREKVRMRENAVKSKPAAIVLLKTL
jgi:hypothetical protein